MPPFLLALLALVIGCYALLIGGATIRFHRVRRASTSQEASSRPLVSIVVPVDSADAPLDPLLDPLHAAAYPSDGYEIVVASADDTVAHRLPSPRRPGPEGPGLQFVHVPDQTPGSLPSRPVREAALGDVLLPLPPGATVSSDWLPAMVQHVPTDAGVIKGPVAYKHNDLFFPRLQALEQVGRTAAAVGAWNAGPLPPHHHKASGRSATDEQAPDAAEGSTSVSAPSVSRHAVAAPEAQVYVAPPASTLGEYVEATARRFRMAVRWGRRSTAVGTGLYGLTHTVLLVTGAVAVALPAWRQPVLLALMAKMGLDLLLVVPAAGLLNQRGLLRSLVPTELFLVLAVPASGLLGLWITLRTWFRSD